MALANCRECRGQVSDAARACPRCGAPWPARQEWRGSGFDWRSSATFLGYPVIHVAFGRDSRGRLRVAKGVIAIGQFAVGLVVVAQIGIGLLFGFGQVIFGLTALAQAAVTLGFGVGQFACGYVAIGQIALGVYALGQVAAGELVWSGERADPAAVAFFRDLAGQIGWH
ncbi:MAG: hypothetical protein IT158_08165 [Bryobacterales bacterium]|nr:hypothetical protein [Bryobacterales bacterium]